MFKRGVLVLVLAAMLAVLSQVQAETREVSIVSSLKNPVVKSVKHHNGKISIMLKDEDDDNEQEELELDVSELEEEDEDGKKKVAKKAHKEEEKDSDDDSEPESDDDEKKVVKKAHKKAVKKAHRKNDEPDSEDSEGEENDDESEEEEEKKKAHKKAHKAHKKQVSVEKKDNGEIVKNYPGGTVRISGKSAPKKGKKAHKKQAPAANATEPAKNTASVTKDVDLSAGESVLLEFGGHVLNLTVAKNGSLIVDADNQTYVLPEVDEADVVFHGDFDLPEEAKNNKTSTAVVPAANVTTAPSMMKMVKRDIALAAKKFSELATTVTADTVSKDAAPIVFVCGLVGALAAIVGVAAVALGRVRHDDAAEDPQSVLADAAVEDVEAGIQSSTEEEKKEDAPAEKSDSLSDSDSDSEVEEGTFANDKNTVSV